MTSNISPLNVVFKHAEMVAALVKPGADILKTLTPELANILHMAVGISGEAGELLDAVKKASVYNKPIDMANVIEELGDMEFYMEGLRTALGISRVETLRQNMTKLAARYSGTYTDAKAQERADKQEPQALTDAFVGHGMSIKPGEVPHD